MTHLRRLLLVVVASCVALAVGIALGGGPLQGESDDKNADAAAERDALQADLDEVQQARILDEALVEARAADLLASRLDGRPVTLLRLPGTDEEWADDLRAAITTAGGSVAVDAQLQPDLIDPGKKTYVDSVATNSVSGEPGLEEIVTGETYDRIGALITRAYVGTGDNTSLDDVATMVDSELQGARLMQVQGEPGRRGSLVILTGAAPDDDAATNEAQNVMLTAITRALVRGSDGFLLARPTGADPETSLATALGTDDALSTDTSWSSVNVTDGAAAQVTSIYALAAAMAGNGGTFGIQSDAAVLPPGIPVPTG